MKQFASFEYECIGIYLLKAQPHGHTFLIFNRKKMGKNPLTSKFWTWPNAQKQGFCFCVSRFGAQRKLIKRFLRTPNQEVQIVKLMEKGGF